MKQSNTMDNLARLMDAEAKLSFINSMSSFRLEKYMSRLIVSKLLSGEMPSMELIEYCAKAFVKNPHVHQSDSLLNKSFNEDLSRCIQKNKTWKDPIPVPVELLECVKDIIFNADWPQCDKKMYFYGITSNISYIQSSYTIDQISECAKSASELETSLLLSSNQEHNIIKNTQTHHPISNLEESCSSDKTNPTNLTGDNCETEQCDG